MERYDLDSIMREFEEKSSGKGGNNMDNMPYDWAKDTHLGGQRKEEPSAENSLVIPANPGFVMEDEAPTVDYAPRRNREQEYARKIERTSINSTTGHKSSNRRNKTTTESKPKEAEWKEQASVFKRIKDFAQKKVIPTVVAIGLVATGAAGMYGYQHLTDHIAEQQALENFEEQFYTENIAQYETTTSTGDGKIYDEEGIAKNISQDGTVDKYDYYGLYNNLGEGEANRVLAAVDSENVDKPYDTIEDYMRSNGQVNESNQQDVDLWRENIGKSLAADSEIEAMFQNTQNGANTQTNQASRGGK